MRPPSERTTSANQLDIRGGVQELQELQESWRAGELESWRAGELESWRAGELESWSQCIEENSFRNQGCSPWISGSNQIILKFCDS
jgi:hypothetical protein